MITLAQLREDFAIYERNQVILWGCRYWGELFLDFAQKMDIEIVACCDNDKALWGTEFLGISVISPQELEEKQKKEGNVLVQLAVDAKHEKAVAEQVEAMGGIVSVETIRNLFDFYNDIIKKLIEKNPQIGKDTAVHIQTSFINPVVANSFEDGALLVLQAPKTGDNTLVHTFEKNNIPVHFLYHQTNHLTKIQNRVKITTAIREPIIRHLSALFENLSTGRICCNYMIDYEDFSYFLQQGDVQNIFDKLIETNQNRSNKFAGTHRPISAFFHDFEKNAVNVLDYPFDQEKGYTIIREGNFDIFFYQLEKLNDLVPELSEWVGVPFTELVNSNEASGKWIADSYKKAQKELKFSQAYFDDCYNDPYVQHCYSQADLEKFKERWQKNIDPNK